MIDELLGILKLKTPEVLLAFQRSLTSVPPVGVKVCPRIRELMQKKSRPNLTDPKTRVFIDFFIMIFSIFFSNYLQFQTD